MLNILQHNVCRPWRKNDTPQTMNREIVIIGTDCTANSVCVPDLFGHRDGVAVFITQFQLIDVAKTQSGNFVGGQTGVDQCNQPEIIKTIGGGKNGKESGAECIVQMIFTAAVDDPMVLALYAGDFIRESHSFACSRISVLHKRLEQQSVCRLCMGFCS